MVSLGTRIRFMRLVRGLSQKQFAQAVELGQWDVSAYENDRHVPTPEKLNDIARALAVNFNQPICIQPDGRLDVSPPEAN